MIIIAQQILILICAFLGNFKGEIMSKITKNTTIGEVLKLCPNAETILQGFGMHCVHCPMSQMETLEEAGSVHEADIDLMVNKLEEDMKK